MRIRRKSAFFPILIFLIILMVTGCRESRSTEIHIELETPDGSDPSTSDAVFPRFVSEDEVFQKELDKLNKEVDPVRKSYDKRTDKGKVFTVHTYINDLKNVPQCTVCWYEEHSLLDDDYNLMTLAYNKNTEETMTSKEALNSMQIDGITLSTNVGRLYSDMHLPGTITETEMQGFETDETGEVTSAFMKLIIELEDPEDPEETIEEIHFYRYLIKEESLRPLSESGYELP